MKFPFKYFLFAIVFSLFIGKGETMAQQVYEIEPLFEYPQAPDEMTNLTERCDFVASSFWNPFNTKSQEAVNQIALNDAFKVYLTSLVYASEKTVNKSLDNIIKKISGNPTLLVQFEKAAEEYLYGPRATMRADNVYLRFLDAAIKNKKVSKSRKEKYLKRANLIRSTEVGQQAPSFKFTDATNKEANYFPMSTPTILIFGNPADGDWRIARVKMETDSRLSQAIDKGKINIIYISLNTNDNWKNLVSNYSSKWNVGISENIGEIYDLRSYAPSIYLVGNNGKILLKNLPLDQTLEKALEIIG